MPKLVESIKVLNGAIRLLDLHNERLNQARQRLFGTTDFIRLENHLQVPENCQAGLFKCRVVYEKAVESVEWIPYKLPVIHSLRVVEAGSGLDYSLKFTDRSELARLHARRGDCDEVLILKDGELTDASFANLVFDDGDRYWTPLNPLLKGVKRAYYLSQNRIFERRITLADLPSFQSVHLINAMLDLGDCRVDCADIRLD
ncbi:MAG TPA: aminotransferase class IV [Flavilitoribacter sp.]|nr:aminotransferase class IV [Flavilitoribacter sp.]HMQ86848.1 aminotransferase class IV [Flavilitoribacter sp.]